jgi:CBS domain containing-hemolysin-like protein|tara:strand:+ start:418 stop:570 length:153 start_codon:yes stop_codon:yes gene_type:complete
MDENLIKKILKKNYSRIPIYYGSLDKKLVIGILLTKSLIGVNVADKMTVQ